MKKNIIAIAGLVALAAAVRSDLSVGEIGFGPGRSMEPVAALKEAGASEAPRPAQERTVAPGKALEWISIPGGEFMMGTADWKDSKPVHEVHIKTFEMSKTEVTVKQYAECVNAGKCTEPGTGYYCNWGVEGRELHPVNCVSWEQANAYARFKSARLPSEAEWEYAARSGGKNQKYPWGDEEATCERAVMYGADGLGCGGGGTWPVCSKPGGNTAQGLCDMAGNVWEWTADWYHDSYRGAPIDGKAWENPASFIQVMRGGSFIVWDASNLRADFRVYEGPGFRPDALGFRLARSGR